MPANAFLIRRAIHFRSGVRLASPGLLAKSTPLRQLTVHGSFGVSRNCLKDYAIPSNFHLQQQRGFVSSGNVPSSEHAKTTIHFTVADRIGILEAILSKLAALQISLSRIESRPSKSKGDYEFFVDFDAKTHSQLTGAINSIKEIAKEVKVISSGASDAKTPPSVVPWFPRKITDLDTFAEKVLSYGEELDADHPGFTDPEYRQRRQAITDMAKKHRHGLPLPRVEYTPEEIKTWGIVYNKLTKLYSTHACYEHRYIFPLLVQNCGYREDNIPQLEDISKFLKDCTGWTIRPVMGLLSSRDFLNALAFRVFHSTQYIRHHSKPLYTPEPDVCHELLGHVPLYADPDFAAFSQEIGLASLGATDEDLEKLATIYWFTVEFGLTREGDNVKAYGAGLLSSFGELEYCLTDEPKKLPFDCETAGVQPYPITTYQPVYFVTDSFKRMKEQVRDYASGLKRPFAVNYNALTESIEVLDTKDKITRYAGNIRGDLTRLISAIDKLYQ